MVKFEPKVIEEGVGGVAYGLMLVELRRCSTCNRYMIDTPSLSDSTFPQYFNLNFTAQCKAANWVTRAHTDICVECVKAGKETFQCYLCKKTKTSDKIQISIGKSPMLKFSINSLCQDCYKSVSAEVWENAKKELEKEHEYDYK